MAQKSIKQRPQVVDGRGIIRPHLLTMFLALVVTLALIGGFQAAGIFKHGAPPSGPAHLGEAVAVPGGLLRVERVIPEYMAPMHLSKFAQSGMSMSGMGMDMAPEGYRRFTVELTLAGEAYDGLHYSADVFQLSGKSMQATGPIRSSLGNGVVPQGSLTLASLTFQVPEAASDLLLSFRNGERPIGLELQPPMKSHDHSDGHDHAHDSPGQNGR